MPNSAELLALTLSALYSGAAVYISLVEHPARLASGNEAALTQWAQSVKRTPRYAAVALVAALSGLIRGSFQVCSLWTWGGFFLLAIVPFTVLFMLPLQRRLTSPAWVPASPQTRSLLKQWGHRHGVRTLFGLAALALFLRAVVTAT